METNTSLVESSFATGVWFCTRLGMFVALVADTPEELLSMRKSLEKTKLTHRHLLTLLTRRPNLWIALGDTEEAAREQLSERIDYADQENLAVVADSILPQISTLFLEIDGHDFRY